MVELIFALDVDNIEEAEPFVEIPGLEFYKVGLQLFLKEGYRVVEFLKQREKKVFLDLKFHDIPNTVASAARQAVRMGVDVFNIHITGGYEMVRRAVEATRDENEKMGRSSLIIGVTILTSLSQEDLERVGFSLSPKEAVIHLAKMGFEAGLDGVVCSPVEAKKIKENTSNSFLTFTPGITLYGGSRDDQKRTMSVREAVENGSDFLIVGRPIRNSPDPVRTVAEILRIIHG